MTSIVRKELKLLLKGKGNLFFLIIMPMLFMLLFGSAFSGADKAKLTVPYIDEDNTPASQQLLTAMNHVKGFALQKQTDSVQDAVHRIQNGTLDALLVIPHGFGSALGTGHPATLTLYRDPTADTVTGPIASMVSGVANAYQSSYMQQQLQAKGLSSQQVQQVLRPVIQLQQVTEQVAPGASVSMVQQVVPGYTVMFVFFIIMTMLRSFLGEQESGMLTRLRSTPLHPLTYLMGMWLPNILAVMVQCAVLLTFGHLVYGVALGDITAIAAIVICLAICGTGLGLAVSFLSRGENQGRGITMLISLGGAALGGVWVPMQMLPQALQTIGRCTPQYWAQQGFEDVMLRGWHVADVWQSLVVLLAFGVAGLVVALLRFPRFLRAAAH
ncbi:hypothetical protein GCM10025857_32840 [Alicyclobacillus contaminans]|uniref:ABC transporter permease n=1 Tax=Alicyclobacillus contaminans TaxID=392016 RepID=UPI000426A368|nr:ABC transporter permease [Alicyclobacillus contaminans]GMA51927.1 hypothetical protein GCM10025857_32840 [Alicyclobacillus contaminans]